MELSGSSATGVGANMSTPETLQAQPRGPMARAVQPQPVAKLTPFQLSQRGMLQPLKQAVEGGFHVDTPDEEGITCLHWCAINNRLECIQYLLDEGANVDPVGGELQATPLHWAIRQGHMRVVVLLVKGGANTAFKDAQGYNPLHVASQFGFMNIAAYLVARGADVNAKDNNGRTPLIWAATKAFSSDLIRCLMALDASLNLRDSAGNTALHYAVAANNMFAVIALVHAGASKDVKNEQLRSSIVWGIVYLFLAIWGWVMGNNFFNHGYKPGESPVSMSVYFGTKILFAVTTFHLFWPAVFADGPLMSLPMKMVVAVNIFLLAWSFYKTHTGDPGYIRPDRSTRERVIIELAERDELNGNTFCPTCAIRRPLRSKHSAVTNKCVAKFDHYCPFVENDVGAWNHHYFMNFLVFFVMAHAFFLLYSFQYMYHAKPPGANVLKSFADWCSFSPWVMFLMAQCCVHLTWVALLLGMQLKQVAITGLTTNEEINMWKYDYLQGYRRSPWHRGAIGNLVELYTHSTDWTSVFETPAQLHHRATSLARVSASDNAPSERASLLPPSTPSSK
ncbi:hypothetical protein PTSG_11551 [Salpingoeca rosetta]|uniref:Palmitoyltransferase n=1 Tax=Salpingoeca rosetta (strain ATCC 50818 / BSB-021) TaxID=946362 RepID=F2TVM9_SALR5|nr:uncharacterized protein PTSG_11551 [Salpingoeca rosetta]EGD72125.1 hypothetical protein PTSG_11551 [Salpingoeca rosetta]|eukprot:XP_004998697.1 hypothetical protein PTSG_11551 [Salpingoeca rosetta]